MSDDDPPRMRTFSRVIDRMTFLMGDVHVGAAISKAYAETDEEILEWAAAHGTDRRQPEYEVTTEFRKLPMDGGVVMERIARIVRRSAAVTMLRSVDATAEDSSARRP